MLVYAGVRYPEPIPGDGSGPEYDILCFMTHVKVVLIQSNRINHSVHQQAFFCGCSKELRNTRDVVYQAGFNH